MRLRLNPTAGALAAAAALASSFVWVSAQQGGGAGVAIDGDDIGGVVTSAKGPEAGVWVVAETTDLPTRFARMVVTNDQGRYVLPDLPKASYQVFVRGYGLVDSARVTGKPGDHLDLKAVVAPDGRAAAQVYPANYWYGMLEFSKGAISDRDATVETKACFSCHQVGDIATREVPKGLGSFGSTLDAWDHRTSMGPNGAQMSAAFQKFGPQRAAYADWTDRIAKGEYPKQPPPRPSGVERNVVITEWDWALPTSRRSDAAATDERTPTLNANGIVYGAVQSSDLLVTLDPRTNTAGAIKVPSSGPVLDAKTPRSPVWGDEPIWKRQAEPRSVTMDSHGRVWLTARIRAPQGPAYCTDGALNKFAKYYPMTGPGTRQIEVFDPKTKEFTSIDTCFAADHNHFDDHDTMVYGQVSAIGWFDTATWDKTHDARASQGWCPAVLDTNGDGKITAWTEPTQPIDPKMDHRIDFTCYSASINPVDGGVWCSGIGARDTKLVRIERGSNPPQTCKAEVYEPPPGKMPLPGSGGTAVDSDGVVWQNWRGAYQMMAFDRRKCKTLNGPSATGQQCPEGWTVYSKPSPTFQGAADDLRTDMLYLTHMDHANALGLGKDTVLAGDINSDSFFVVTADRKQVLTLRVPYPLGFYSRSASGRIDDPNGGWKGRGVWSTYSMYTPWHQEGGKGALPKLVKFQMRPDPLAK